MDELSMLPWWLWLLLAALLLGQSTWLFVHARKQRAYPWFWGIWGLLHFPLPLLCYGLFIYWRHRRKKTFE